MDALGSLSQIYMFLLLFLLFVGSGLALWGFINFLIKKTVSTGPGNEGQNVVNRTATILSNQPTNHKKSSGGYFMNNNGWIKLAVFSFVGILISVILLGFISTSGQGLSSQHNQMQNGTTGTMQMQNSNTGMSNDQMMMQQQLTQMQQQLSQMQQQMGMMQNNAGAGMSAQSNMSSMPQSGGSGSGMMMDSMMTMMGGMMDMMGSMQQQQGSGSMSNMPASTPAPAMAPMAPMPMM